MTRALRAGRSVRDFADAWLALVIADAVLNDAAKVFAALLISCRYAEGPCQPFLRLDGSVVAKVDWLCEAAGKDPKNGDRWVQRAAAALSKRGYLRNEIGGGRAGKDENGEIVGNTTRRVLIIKGQEFAYWAARR